MVLLVVPLAGAGCSERRPANVLLISVDTLRPDRLGFGGHARPTSPAIDRLAGEGVVFPNAFSVSGWTLPSMATILSGRYPKDHGAIELESALLSGLPTLAGVLERHGYATRGYVSHVILVPEYGFATGFDHFDDSVLDVGHPHVASTDRQLTDRVIAGLADLHEPFFLWVHYFGPHFDYLRHDGWKSFGRSDVDRYDQEIAYTDAQIGRLLDALRTRGLYENTVVVLTADHGEEFGEHRGALHYTLYDEVLRVPLVIRGPSLAAGTRPTTVEQIDLLPTILGLLAIEPGPGERFPGRDVLAADVARGPAFFERDRPAPYRQRGILEGRYKLTVIEEVAANAPATGEDVSDVENVHPGIYLYDLEADPRETTNLYREDDPHARELLAKLAAHFSDGAPASEKLTIDPKRSEQLRSLGYAQ